MFRVGNAFDIHRLREGRALILGGVEIPHHKGLEGHSDADGLIHAIIDSFLGALALGDIGTHFPDNNPLYKDIQSSTLLRQTYTKVLQNNYRLVNLDTVIIAQSPKLRTYIDSMRQNLSDILQCALNQISIKATTAETLGTLGREEGIAFIATSLLERF